MMPIDLTTEPGAASTAVQESVMWAEIHRQWTRARHPEIWAELAPVEVLVMPGFDPGEDLAGRGRRWGYQVTDADLGDLSRFAAALATTEAEAWLDGDRPLATRAFEERRFLVADRILPWLVPWFQAVGRCFPETRVTASRDLGKLLALGERRRYAPALTGHEGIVLPGHDGYGPADQPLELHDRIESLWGGMVVFDRSLRSLTGNPHVTRRTRLPRDPELDGALADWYEVAAVRWERLAEQYPGTSRYWSDLAVRCRATAALAAEIPLNR